MTVKTLRDLMSHNDSHGDRRTATGGGAAVEQLG